MIKVVFIGKILMLIKAYVIENNNLIDFNISTGVKK